MTVELSFYHFWILDLVDYEHFGLQPCSHCMAAAFFFTEVIDNICKLGYNMTMKKWRCFYAGVTGDDKTISRFKKSL